MSPSEASEGTVLVRISGVRIPPGALDADRDVLASRPYDEGRDLLALKAAVRELEQELNARIDRNRGSVGEVVIRLPVD